MEDIGHKSGHKSGHLMLITPERVFYAGLLGRPRARCSGAFNVYVAIEGGLWLTTADGRETFCELAAVLPNVRHTIASDFRSVLSLVIEPESVPPGVFEDLIKRLSGPESADFANRIRAAYVALRERQGGNDISNAEFDLLCLGEVLAPRALDPRVARSIVQIGKFCGEPVTAASCAVEAGLSPSRFLHLFKEETGISFR
ncbi:MAG: AraC family transcriptional regulator, partial [Bradyrhizobium sp.]